MGPQPVFLNPPGIVERMMPEIGADTILQKFISANIRGMDRNFSSMISALGSSLGVARGQSNQSTAILLLSSSRAVLVEGNRREDAAAEICFLAHKLLDVRPPSHWGINE